MRYIKLVYRIGVLVIYVELQYKYQNYEFSSKPTRADNINLIRYQTLIWRIKSRTQPSTSNP